MNKLNTRASSINRAMDQIGDKWCLLIIQEVFWGINSFNEMKETMGVSRGVLSDRLRWLESVDCLSKAPDGKGGKRLVYHLTPKSIELYDGALMALVWERRFFSNPELDTVKLFHRSCGHEFSPEMLCRGCNRPVEAKDIDYKPGPGAARDERDKKVRRRSSISVASVPSKRSVYRNFINIVGDRWTANVIALSFHGFSRFDQFHKELPIATNVLSDRLKFLVEEGVFERSVYLQKPKRYEYLLTEKGEALYPWFLSTLQWGDKWCDDSGNGKPMRLIHKPCGLTLKGQAKCSECGDVLQAKDVRFNLGEPEKQ